MHATKNPSLQAKSQKFKALPPSEAKTQEESSNNMSISSNSESSESTNSKSFDVPQRVKFQPKVSPTEYQRFIYKCLTCMVGFKRRGWNQYRKIAFIINFHFSSIIIISQICRHACQSYG